MQNKTKAEFLKEIQKLRRENNSLKNKINKPADTTKSKNNEPKTLLGDIFENAGLGIALVDTTGKQKEVNYFLTKMFGYSKSELLKMHFIDFTYSEDNDKDLKLFKQVVNGKRKSYQLDKRFVKKNGHIIWGKLTVTAIKGKNDKTKYIIRIVEDITKQKETEKKLASEQTLLNALMHYSPDSIYFKDNNSKFIRVNKAKYRKHGFKSEEALMGKTDFDLYTTEHAKDAYDDEKEILRTGKPVINKEEKINWLNGKSNWVSTTKMPLFDDNGNIIGTFGITRDITDRVLVENVIRESEERFRSLFELSADGIFMLTDVYEDCNPAALRLFNCKREDIIGKSPAKLSPEIQPDGKRSVEKIKEKISLAFQGKPQHFYWQHKRLDDRMIDVEISLNAVNLKEKTILQANLRDISEQLNARKIESAVYKISEAAHTSQDIDNLYKRIHEIIGELMPSRNFYISLFDEKNNILSFPYFVDEYDPPQPPKKFGKGLTEYIIRKGEAMLIDAKRDLELREAGEVELIGAPQAVWLGIPLKLDDKTVGVMVVQDYENEKAYGEAEKSLLTFVSEQITQAIERKKNSEAIKSYAQELIQLNKTKDKFFSILAHDLKNPFITILGFSDLLLNDYHELADDERLFYVEEMKKSAEISHNLLQNLLQWSRSQTGRIEYRPTSINMRKIVDNNVELLRVLAERKKINLSSNIKEDVFVYADEDMITTVIRNLLTNAIKFTKKEGEVKLLVKCNGQMVEMCICDNGIGMDQETISELFRLDISHSQPGTDNETGTGLGLILCKEFIEKNGGTIKVESSPGKGSKFSFSLQKAK